jgi:hypothetical protein
MFYYDKQQVNNTFMKKLITIIASYALVLSSVFAPYTASAALDASENITSGSFRIIVCDGPNMPKEALAVAQAKIDADAKALNIATHPYVPCDFAGLMTQIQHFLNIAIIGGVVVAVLLFTYAGFKLIQDGEKNRTQAKEIFQKVLVGLLIMLSAWGIVYTILTWVTPAATEDGSPSPYIKLLK